MRKQGGKSAKTITGGMAFAVLMGFMAGGCHTGTQTPTNTRGVVTASATQTSVNALAHAPKTQAVTLTGEMTEKCPAAGCWFMLRDKTGIARVDTKAAGFVVSDVPLHTQITVFGTVSPGTQPTVQATGIKF